MERSQLSCWYKRVVFVLVWAFFITSIINTNAESRMNFALDGTITASSTYNDPWMAAIFAIDGVRVYPYWNDNTNATFPDTLTINLGGSKKIDEIDVFSLQDAGTNAVEPTPSMTGALYVLKDFDIEYYNGVSWVLIQAVRGNNLIWYKTTLTSPITTDQIRISILATADGFWSRVVEVEVWGPRSTYDAVRNVKTFGAVGNGIINDGPYIQAAIDSLPSSGGKVFIPAGVYSIGSSITINKSGVFLIGAGRNATTLSHGFNGNLLTLSGTVGSLIGFVNISDMDLISNRYSGSPFTGDAITLSYINRSTIQRVRIEAFQGRALHLYNETYDTNIYDCNIQDNGTASIPMVEMEYSCDTIRFADTHFNNFGGAVANDGTAVKTFTNWLWFSNCKFESGMNTVAIDTSGELCFFDKIEFEMPEGKTNPYVFIRGHNTSITNSKFDAGSTSGQVSGSLLSIETPVERASITNNVFTNRNPIAAGTAVQINSTSQNIISGNEIKGFSVGIDETGTANQNAIGGNHYINVATPERCVESANFQSGFRVNNLLGVQGISNNTTKAKNLRGSVTISGTATSAAVTFTTPEYDSNYFVTLGQEPAGGTPSYGRLYITNRSTTGFTIRTTNSPGSGNSINVHWHLIR